MSEKSQKQLAKETMATIIEAKEKVNNTAAFEKEVFANLGISTEDKASIVAAAFSHDREPKKETGKTQEEKDQLAEAVKEINSQLNINIE